MYAYHAFRETQRTHHLLQAESPDIPGDPEVTQELAICFANKYVALAGLVGSTLYDIAHDGRDIDPDSRQQVALASSRMAKVQDYTDTIIDDDMADRPLAERQAFIRQVLGSLLTGRVEISPSTPLMQRATLYSAQQLHDTILTNDRLGVSSPALYGLVEAAGEQLVAGEPRHQLESAKRLGASCCEAIAIFSEIADNTHYPHMREISRHIGAYTEVIDHWYELDADLAEGSTTYATLRLAQEGDTPGVRRNIRSEMLREAQNIRQAILPDMSPYQRRRYNGLLDLGTLKYRLVHWQQRLLAKRNPPELTALTD